MYVVVYQKISKIGASERSCPPVLEQRYLPTLSIGNAWKKQRELEKNGSVWPGTIRILKVGKIV